MWCFEDEDFAGRYARDGRPGLSPGPSALFSVVQFAQKLSGRAAANAVPARIGRKYAPGPELDGPGFGHTVPCGFRARLAEGDAAGRLAGG
jgi:hypothetical protein